MFLYLFLTAALLFGSADLVTASPAEPAAASDKTKDAEPPKESGQPVVKKHTIVFSGKELSYTTTAGQLPITNDAGEIGAYIFYTAYTADNPAGRQRPLLFLFNGGPGAASVWLHLGAVGPRRVEMLPDGNMPPPPYRLVDNPSTWLDKADLVFVDPVGTGYSRAVKPDLTKNYTSVQGDIDSVGRFIRLYLTRYQRWNAPIFLVGESYGSFRAAGLSEYLAEHGVGLNGILLVSTVLNMQTISFDQGNDLPYSLYLPSYAATAWYHGKLAPELEADLEKTVAQAERWAATDYLAALYQGERLSAKERQAAAEKLSYFTGLSASFVDQHDLRIDNRTFVRELLRDRSQRVGFMDSRFHAENVEPSAPSGFDPTVATIRPPYTSMVNQYLRDEIGYASDLEYFTLGGGIGHWDWEAKNSYADTSDNLRNTFAKNPYMKLFVASGYFDLATPHAAGDYTLAHLGLTPVLRRNITTRRYRAGHMMYLDTESLALLKKDVAEFLEGAMKNEVKGK